MRFKHLQHLGCRRLLLLLLASADWSAWPFQCSWVGGWGYGTAAATGAATHACSSSSSVDAEMSSRAPSKATPLASGCLVQGCCCRCRWRMRELLLLLLSCCGSVDIGSSKGWPKLHVLVLCHQLLPLQQ
jgi:hypothetical protein